MLTKMKPFKSEIHLSSLAQPKGCTSSPSSYYVNVSVKIRKVTHPIGTLGRPLHIETS